MTQIASAIPDSPAEESWTVWRIDDNGNTFVVRTQLGHTEAERLVAEFAARGHKQMYWAEQERGSAKSSSPADGGE